MAEMFKDTTCWEIENKTGFELCDQILLRFLRARKFNVDKAAKLLRSHLEWRDEWKPTTLTLEDIPNGYKMGMLRFWEPSARGGHPVLHIDVGLWEPNAYEIDEFTKKCAFYLETCVRMAEPGVETGIIVFDLKGWTAKKHFSRKAMKMLGVLVQAAQDQFPEVLLRVYIVNVPWFFRAAWVIIKPWIDPVTVSKIRMNPNMNLLQEFMDPAQIEKRFGGTREEPYPIEIPEAGRAETTS